MLSEQMRPINCTEAQAIGIVCGLQLQQLYGKACKVSGSQSDSSSTGSMIEAMH